MIENRRCQRTASFLSADGNEKKFIDEYKIVHCTESEKWVHYNRIGVFYEKAVISPAYFNNMFVSDRLLRSCSAGTDGFRAHCRTFFGDAAAQE